MYKKSIFNVSFEKNGQSFLYNSHSGAFVTLSNEYQKSLNNLEINKLDQIPAKHLEDFLNAGFIVKKTIDESGFYTYQNNVMRFDSNSFILTIATTLQCNFRCPYCYEEHVDEYLEGEKEKDLIKFIEQNLENKKFFHICWYGGEPLLKKDLIDRVSKHVINYCEEKGIQYTSSMVSNGYLLNRKTAEKMVNENKVTSVQITLDGGPKTHNLTRILRNGKGTFDQILQNIKDVCDIIDIQIRVNVSKENINDVYKLFPILIEENLNKKVFVYFAPVTPSTDTCQSISETCLNTKEFAEWESNLIEYTDKIGFEMGKLYPKNSGGASCQAVDNNAFVVDAAGDFYKCWLEVGQKHLSVGSLKEGITNSNRLIKWMNWRLPDKCNTCSILPLCMGRCPDLSIDNKDFECNQLRYNIKNRLYRYYVMNPLEKQKVDEKVLID